MRFAVDCDKMGQIVRIVGLGMVTIHSGRQTIFCFANIEGITLCAGDEVNTVAGRVCGIGVVRIIEADDNTSEG